MSEVDINSSISQFSDLLSPVTDDLFKCSSSSGNTADTTTYNTNKHQDSQNAWFTDESSAKRRHFLSFLNRYRNNPSDENSQLLVNSRTEYKTTLRTSRRNYFNDQTKILESYKYNNAKLYWRLLKDTAKVKSPDIPLT